MKVTHTDIPSIPKTHASLSPRTNWLLLCIWEMVVISGFLIFQPRLPFTLEIAGGLLGALTGMMQHLSMVHDPHGFVAASSLMGVLTCLNQQSMGPQVYSAPLFQQGCSRPDCFLVKGPPYRVLPGYLAAYSSLMLVRDALTLRDTYVLQRLGNSTPAAPEIST